MNKQQLVIGSAGHVDHGKSSIIKELTGIDPTRLKEEKEKNITIDLGFSYFTTNNQTIGIVDLPGHEKFISNMIVGSSNIDMILFVIAADDGIMPQTIEHFEILMLLKIKHAIIILNKIDLVDTSLLEQRRKEITEFFENTPFSNAPIVETSIYQENTINTLKTTLNNYLNNNQFIHPNYDIFRMAIDRSFTIQGQGCIVTGTSQGKDLHVNEFLQVYPSNHLVKVRNIQNHNINVLTIQAGQRTALQLSNISKNEIKRGSIIASPNSLFASRYLDVLITVLKSSKPIKNNQLVRIFHQTKEYIARIKLNSPSIKPNTQSFATLVLQDEIYALRNDLALVRSFSPIKTIAGIEIINILKTKPKITENYYNRYLNNNESTHIINLLENDTIINDHILKTTSLNYEQTLQALNILIINKTITKFIYNNKPSYILSNYLNQLEQHIITTLETFHQDNPLLSGQNILKLYKDANLKVSYKIFKALITNFSSIVLNDETISLATFKISYTNEQKTKRNSIITFLKHQDYNLLTFNELYDKFTSLEDKLIIQALIDNKAILIINQQYLILDRMYQTCIKIIKELAFKNNEIYLKDFKDELKCSRKYALLLLEYFDYIKLTKRIDDYRILQKNN